MSDYADIVPMARKAYADHRMTRGPGVSWRLAKPGTGNYSFRVTWTPGAVVVTGDIGTIAYEVWPAFGTLWGAVDLVNEAGWGYLTGKSGVKQEFDPEATVRRILQDADDSMRRGDFSIWKTIVEEWLWRSDKDNYRSGAVQMKAAAEMRNSCDLTAERVYKLFGDAETPAYSYGPSTRWQYEAVKMWAAEMLRREPAWHRAWRNARTEYKRLRRTIKGGLLWRPEIHRPVRGGTFNGADRWVRFRWESGGESWRAVMPFRALGVDWSRLGIWAYQGSNWPIRDEGDDARFVRATP